MVILMNDIFEIEEYEDRLYLPKSIYDKRVKYGTVKIIMVKNINNKR